MYHTYEIYIYTLDIQYIYISIVVPYDLQYFILISQVVSEVTLRRLHLTQDRMLSSKKKNKVDDFRPTLR